MLQDILSQIRAEAVVAVVRADAEEVAYEAAKAAYAGGLKVLEITFTTPGAAHLVQSLRRELPGALVGCGSVVTLAQAREALRAEASFCVSPHTDLALVQELRGSGVLYVPGGMTPTELMTAYNAGCSLLKLFPGGLVGLAGLSAILAPLPFLPLIVTGGVDESNAAAFLKAGAAAICAGNGVFSKKALAEKDWAAVTAAAAKLKAACRTGA